MTYLEVLDGQGPDQAGTGRPVGLVLLRQHLRATYKEGSGRVGLWWAAYHIGLPTLLSTWVAITWYAITWHAIMYVIMTFTINFTRLG